MRISLPLIDNQRPDVCGPCGGQCCKGGPGIYHPDDFPDILRDLASALDAGSACIDWWEGSLAGVPGPTYYPRPPVVYHEGQKLHAAWEGACSNLGPAGCRLTYRERPAQCRLLVPMSPRRPECHYPDQPGGTSYKEYGASWWLPHQELLRQLVASIKDAERLASRRAARTCEAARYSSS